jgi:hypothetical protein
MYSNMLKEILDFLAAGKNFLFSIENFDKCLSPVTNHASRNIWTKYRLLLSYIQISRHMNWHNNNLSDANHFQVKKIG